jgi:hypothetical protein
MMFAFVALLALVMAMTSVTSFKVPPVQVKKFNPAAVVKEFAAQMTKGVEAAHELDNMAIQEDPEIVPAPKCGFCFG